MTHQIIRVVSLAHCKRGPELCEQCRAMHGGRICLLSLFPPGEDGVQRRLIEVQVAGQAVWREYDVVRIFDSAEEAMGYAQQHGIQDVAL